MRALVLLCLGDFLSYDDSPIAVRMRPVPGGFQPPPVAPRPRPPPAPRPPEPLPPAPYVPPR